jgi:hypothetical protein
MPVKDPFAALIESLPQVNFVVPDAGSRRKMKKPKKSPEDFKEPVETVAVPTCHLKAVVDRATFHPPSTPSEILAAETVGPEDFCGKHLGREGVIDSLAATSLPADLRHNARIYGHIEEPEAKLSSRRKWRNSFGAIDRASKYTDANRWGEVDTTSKKFKDLGKGIFYGVKDGSHHSDEFLDIVRCYDTNTRKNVAGYYNYGSIHDWREHGIQSEWVIYVDVAMGQLDGRGGGLVHDARLDETLTEMVLSGHVVHAKIHSGSRFGDGVYIHEWWKNLDHNEEFLAVLCTHRGCTKKIDYDILPANLDRDRRIYERELESGRHGQFTVRFKQRKGRNVPVKKTKPIPYVARLKMSRGVRFKQWEKMVMCDTKPPPPLAPILTDMNWKIAINSTPVGSMLKALSSFVWDPRFECSFDNDYGWIRKKRKGGCVDKSYPPPTLEDYVRWSGANVGGYETEED